METKKRKKLYNALMVFIIVTIAVVGAVIVGVTRGYIGNKADSINVSEVYGVASIDKNGIVYTMDEKTNVTEGNTISTKTRARVRLEKNGDKYVIGENSTAVVRKINDEQVEIELVSGEMLVFMSGAGSSSVLTAAYATTKSDDGIFSVSARTGTTTIYSFAGEAVAEIEEKSETLPAGSCICVMDSEYYRADIDIHSLSELQLSLLLELTAERRLCFTGEELKSLEASRQNENSYGGGDTVYLDGSILSANADTTVQGDKDTWENLKSNTDESPDFGEDGGNTEKNGSDEEDKKGDTPDPPPKVKDDTDSGNKGTTEAGKNDSKTENNESTTTREHATTEGTITVPSATEHTSTTEDKAATEKPKTEHTEATTEHRKEDNRVKTCTLQIRCDTILNNKKDLKPGKEVYVPKNGVILEAVTVEFQDGDTAFDVLKRTCDAYGIQLEYSYTPLYGSYYVEGINYLYEFDCGSQSGWRYKVNGWFPNYGCSSYVLYDNDNIVFYYTCQGLGADVGGGVY